MKELKNIVTTEKAFEIAMLMNPEFEKDKLVIMKVEPDFVWDGLDISDDESEEKFGNIFQVDFRENVTFENSFRFYDDGLWEHNPDSIQLEEIKRILGME